MSAVNVIRILIAGGIRKWYRYVLN